MQSDDAEMEWKEQMEKILFSVSEDETVEFYVIEQVRISGHNYLLVADSEEEEAEAWILKDVSEDSEAEACYEFVEDEDEFAAVAKLFEEELDDVDFQ